MKRDAACIFSNLFLGSVFSAILCVIFAIVPLADAAAPDAGDQSGQAAAETLLKTYRTLTTYQAKVIFTVETDKGRTRQTQTTDYKIFFDRLSGKLILDRPDYQLAIEQNKLLLVMENMPTHHVEQPIPASWNYEKLTATLPILTAPLMPDMIFLTSDQPWRTLTGISQPPISLHVRDTSSSTSSAEKPITQIQIMDRSQKQLWTLILDPLTGLISEAVLTSQSPADADPKASPQSTQLEKTTLRYQFQVQPVSTANSQPSDDLVFTPMDFSHSQSVGSLTELIAAQRKNRSSPSMAKKSSSDPVTTDSPATPSNTTSSQKPASTITGPMAPPLNLSFLDGVSYSSSQEKNHLVIYDFWATWCPPCRQGLPQLEQLQTWANQNNKPLKIYTINLQEERSTIKAFVKKTSLSLPVLLDTKGIAANAYQVQAIPHTVFIIGGKIVKVHTGLSADPDFLKNEVNQLLTTYPPPDKAEKP